MPRKIRIECEQRSRAGRVLTDARTGAQPFFYRGEAVTVELALFANSRMLTRPDLSWIKVRWRDAGTLLSETFVGSGQLSASLTSQQWRQGFAALAAVAFSAAVTGSLPAGMLTLEVVGRTVDGGESIYASGTLESATLPGLTTGAPPSPSPPVSYTQEETDALIGGAATAASAAAEAAAVNAAAAAAASASAAAVAADAGSSLPVLTPIYRRPAYAGADVHLAGTGVNGVKGWQMQPGIWLHQGRPAVISTACDDYDFLNGIIEIRLQNPDLTWSAPISTLPAPDLIDGVPPHWVQAHGSEINGQTYVTAQASVNPEALGMKTDGYVFRATDSSLSGWVMVSKLVLDGSLNIVPSGPVMAAHDNAWIMSVYADNGSYIYRPYIYRSVNQGVNWTVIALPYAPSPYTAPSETHLSISGRRVTARIRNDGDTANLEVMLQTVSNDGGLTWGAVTLPPPPAMELHSNGPWGIEDGDSFICVTRRRSDYRELLLVTDPTGSRVYDLPAVTGTGINYGAGFVRLSPGYYGFVRSAGGKLIYNEMRLEPDNRLEILAGTTVDSGRGLPVIVSGGGFNPDTGWSQTTVYDYFTVGTSPTAAADWAWLHDGSVPVLIGISGILPSMTENLVLLATNGTSYGNPGISIYVIGGNKVRFQITNGTENSYVDAPAEAGEFRFIWGITADSMIIWNGAGERIAFAAIALTSRSQAAPLSALTVGQAALGVGYQPTTGLVLRRIVFQTAPMTGDAVAAVARSII